MRIPLEHGRATLALQRLHDGAGPRIVLLHSLGGSSQEWTESCDGWPGSVFALDFSGHGASDWLRGGGYLPEIFAADADLAVAEVGAAYVAGAGVGAYAALLLAGARPDLVPGALLLPGRGLDGGGAAPDAWKVVRRFDAELGAMTGPTEVRLASDPLVRQAETDIRPPAYATAFGARARRLVLIAGATPTPPWWNAVAELPSVESPSVAEPFCWSELAASYLLRGSDDASP